MTPKEKALELVKKYHTQEIDVYIGSGAMTYESAKQCALIAINEILFILEFKLDYKMLKSIDFWQQVKTEVENL